MCADYGVSKVKGRKQRDTENVAIFLKEFREFERNGNLPRFIVMSLGEDHTTGTRTGTLHAGRLRRQQRPGFGPTRRDREQEQIVAAKSPSS